MDRFRIDSRVILFHRAESTAFLECSYMLLPAKYSRLLNAIILPGIMSFIVTAVATAKALHGFPTDFVERWMLAWCIAWPIASTVAGLLGPYVQRFVTLITR